MHICTSPACSCGFTEIRLLRVLRRQDRSNRFELYPLSDLGHISATDISEERILRLAGGDCECVGMVLALTKLWGRDGDEH